MTVMSRREFVQKLSDGPAPVLEGPVFIMEDGVNTGVWLSAKAYVALSAHGRTNSELLSMHGGDFDFEPEKLGDVEIRPATFD